MREEAAKVPAVPVAEVATTAPKEVDDAEIDDDSFGGDKVEYF